MWQILWQIYFGSAPSYVATLDLAMGLIDNEYTSGSNSAVEFLPSKQAVAGSNPVSRSINSTHTQLSQFAIIGKTNTRS